jgi:hypothetical protein
MTRLRACLLCILLPVLATGCLDATRPGVQPNPDAGRAAATDAELWIAIAERVEKGRIADTDQLLRIVKELHAAGDLKDAGKLDAAIPAAIAKNQPLDDPARRQDVANRLRAIK